MIDAEASFFAEKLSYTDQAAELSEDSEDSFNMKDGKSRECDICSTHMTPLWRRGPQGKGTLCNACGVKWSMSRKLGVPPQPEKKVILRAPRKLWKEDEVPAVSPKQNIAVKKPLPKPVEDDPNKPKDFYYCKYCEQSWPLNYFRNSQQFGAHCSNCSRKRRPSVPTLDDREKKRDRTMSDGEKSDEMDTRGRVETRIVRQLQTRSYSPQKYSEDSGRMSTKDLLLVRLLNVVETSWLEEQQLEKIRHEVRALSENLFAREQTTQSQIELIKTQTLDHLHILRSDIMKQLRSCEDLFTTQLKKTSGSQDADVAPRILKHMKETKETIEAALMSTESVTQNSLSGICNQLKSQLDQTRAKLEAVLKENSPADLSSNDSSPRHLQDNDNDQDQDHLIDDDSFDGDHDHDRDHDHDHDQEQEQDDADFYYDDVLRVPSTETIFQQDHDDDVHFTDYRRRLH